MASSINTKRRKGLISEEEFASTLKRYSAQTILTLLKEVSQYPDVKIDWNALVKKTTTGISNAAEYQMLWRHMAYCDILPETEDEKLEPLDDDSDLDFELEAFPPASDEASLEAAAFVKVLLASGLSDDAAGPETVEATLTINVPNLQDSESLSGNPKPSSSKGINITVPVTVQKQLPTAVPAVTMAEGLPARRKRKPWTLEEDNELIAAVKKSGKSNWANILKAELFKGDRTASQLSKRWSKISTRDNAIMVTGGGSGNQSEVTEQQLAANRALSFALDRPMNNSLSASCAVGPANSTKPRATTKNTASVVPNPMVQAAAVAAGARIVSPSTAKSLLKAAQSKKAVRISTTETSSKPGVTPALKPNHLGTRANVHYMCTGLSSASPTTQSTEVPSVSLPPAIKGKMTPNVCLGVGNSCKEEEVQSSPKEDEVKNSSKDSEIKNSPNDEEVKNSSKEQVKPEGMEIACSADIARDGKQDDQAALPDSDIVIEDQMAQNLSKSPNSEPALSDPMQLDSHQIENEKENMKNSPGAAN